MDAHIFQKETPSELKDAVIARVTAVYKAYDKAFFTPTDRHGDLPGWVPILYMIYAALTTFFQFLGSAEFSQTHTGFFVLTWILHSIHLMAAMLLILYACELLRAARTDERRFLPAADEHAPLDVYVTHLVQTPAKQRKFETLQHDRRGHLTTYQGRLAQISLRELYARVPGAIADLAGENGTKSLEEQAEAVTKRVFYLALSEGGH